MVSPSGPNLSMAPASGSDAWLPGAASPGAATMADWIIRNAATMSGRERDLPLVCTAIPLLFTVSLPSET